MISTPCQLAFTSEPTSPCMEFIPLHINEKLRILLLFQVSSSWSSWESFYDACSNSPEIDAKIVLVERMYLDVRLNVLNSTRNFLIENNIGFINDNAMCLETYKPHVIFMQTPYNDTLPKKYQLEILKSLGIRIAYIPYGIEIGGGSMNLRYQFDLAVQQNAWRVFARSVRHKRMYAKYCSSGSAHVVTLGHPRMDIYKKYQNHALEQSLAAKIKDRILFLWNPHFTVEKNGWSTFLKYMNSILSFFEKQENTFLIIRPHPFLFTRLRDKAGWSNKDIEAFKARILSIENAHLDLTANYVSHLNAADILLTDTSSFLLEFFASGKPVIYLNNEDSPGLNDDGDVIDYLYVVNSQNDLTHYLSMLIEGNDPAKANRISAIPEYFETPKIGAGEAIKTYILDTIKGKDTPLNCSIIVSNEHMQAQSYWKDASSLSVAPESYFEKQASGLAYLLKIIGQVKSTIDIGCGNGSLTKLLCEYSEFTKAIDISSKFIEEAKQNLAQYNVDLSIESITDSQSCQTYNLVSCMGVTSGLIDNYIFMKTCDLLVASSKQNGYLLLNDTLSINTEQYVSGQPEGYAAVYRNREDYKACFLSRGCILLEEIVLADHPENSLINTLFLFRVNLK
ncbi:MAG: CDP-glycerol glycerophosphotransferase family protein [Gammaproteobacteria bacterium]|nr:CDP-glycerol glycerophosphotransferase family protein [Gammaproteobacteria bacterium]